MEVTEVETKGLAEMHCVRAHGLSELLGATGVHCGGHEFGTEEDKVEAILIGQNRIRG